MRYIVFVLVALFTLNAPAFAVEPSEILKDPALEERARIISKDIRCVVCQNQSIDGSDSGIAKKMRVLVRERLVKGDTNDQVIEYLVSRYGDFVLLMPPLKEKTIILWFGPVAMVLFGLIGIIFYYRRRAKETAATTGAAPLSNDEKTRLKALMNEEGSET
jgi:cytochrome c-type biogenesis protein CcmH